MNTNLVPPTAVSPPPGLRHIWRRKPKIEAAERPRAAGHRNPPGASSEGSARLRSSGITTSRSWHWEGTREFHGMGPGGIWELSQQHSDQSSARRRPSGPAGLIPCLEVAPGLCWVSGTQLGGQPWSWHMGTTSSIPGLEFWEHARKAAGFDGHQVVFITLQLKNTENEDLGGKKSQ